MTKERLTQIELSNEDIIESDGGTCGITEWTRELIDEVKRQNARLTQQSERLVTALQANADMGRQLSHLNEDNRRLAKTREHAKACIAETEDYKQQLATALERVRELEAAIADFLKGK